MDFFRETCGKCGARRIDRQIGLEASVEDYVAALVAVFREVRRVLRDDGVVFCNLGDSYATKPVGSFNGGGFTDGANRDMSGVATSGAIDKVAASGLKPKDLIGVPWKVAFALQADGWYLRSDIIWNKPNPMPESVRDRPTKSHEYIFLLTKKPRYYWDAEAVKEEAVEGTDMGVLRSRVVADSPSVAWHAKSIKTRQEAGVDSRTAGNGYRNIRSVWTIPTAPFSGAELLADYVGRDGRPYKASPDCPVHGHLVSRPTLQTGEYGEPQDRQWTGIDGTDGRLAQAPRGVPDANVWNSSDTSLAGSTSEHIPQSIGGHRTPDPLPCCADGRGGDDESPCRTSRNAASPTLQACNSDSPRHEDAETAIQHSNGSRRTDPAPATTEPYTASAQSPSRTDGRLGLPGFDGLAERTPASSISQGDSSARPSARTRSRNADKSSQCNCTIVSVDHFATFPPALVEPCIKAGTSERGACPACGTPWVRVVEREGRITEGRRELRDSGRSRLSGGQRSGTVPGSNTRGFPSYEDHTLGWQPGCACDAGDAVPCVVLDPFSGAGTVALVADRLGRDSIGIELNAEYVALSRARIVGDAPLFAQVEGA